MRVCPGENVLLAMLDERVEGQGLLDLEDHIETCARCQELLEQLTRGQGGKTTQKDVRLAIGPSDRATVESMALAEDGQENLGWHLAESAMVDEGDATDPGPDNTDRTVTQSGAENGPGHPNVARRPSAWPSVPGYEILSRLGEGGMGVVFKARRLGLNRLVALKMIRGGASARVDHVARFRIEAEAVARLRHPNIIQIYEIGEVDDLPYVSLELLEGGSLADRIEDTPQPGRAAAELLVTLARGMQAAHQAGIIHRDLKPTNVLYAADGTPKITDFGLAKRLESDDEQTATGQIMGSPSYMAPEQARGHTKNVGAAADIYALGAILYEMLTGRPPFKGETPMETVRQVIDDDPVPPGRLVPRMARDLETICLKCLNKEQHKRFDSAGSLAEDLVRYLNGEPVKARPTSAWERGTKWARRRPLAATAAALLPLTLIGGFLVTLEYQRAQAEIERQEFARTMNKQTQGYAGLLAARKLLEQNQWSDAKAAVNRLQGELATESAPNLTELKNEAGRVLEQIEQHLARDKARAADQARFVEFIRARNRALVHDSRFSGLNLAVTQADTRREALAGLAVFADPNVQASWALAPLPVSYGPGEQEQIREGCYELLFTLAGVVDRPDESLGLLEQAARLRPPTKAYHLRRAEILATASDTGGADRERLAADRIPATTALDHFLLGKERYARGDFRAASRHFDSALALQAGHFWARCMFGLCCLREQPPQPTVAKVCLSSCIDVEREFAWLYVWRGFASYQLAGERHRSGPSPQQSSVRDDANYHFRAAQEDYQHALSLLDQKPDDVLRWATLVNRGQLFIQHEDWDKASDDFQAAIQLNDRRPEAFVGLARVYLMQDAPDRAYAQFSRAIAVEPGSPGLYRGRAEISLARRVLTPAERTRALADLQAAIRLETPGRDVLALDHTRCAALLHALGRSAEALSACGAALKVRPSHPGANQLHIQILLELKRYDEVQRSCDELLARDKSSGAIYELRGLARTASKDHAGAIEDFTQAIALQPGRALLFVRRGGLYLIDGAAKLALHDFDEAVRLDSSDGNALSGRGAARARLGQHREAVADAEKAITLGKPSARRLYAAAQIYARAAAVAGSDARKNGQDAASIALNYQDRGAFWLREAIKKLSSTEQAAFWRDVVQSDPDPAMSALRRRLRADDTVGYEASGRRLAVPN
jgi:eukaryotic-like serine/threonine-protein kinase